MKKIKGIKSIKHYTITDEVISQLKELINQGSLQPGHKLPSEFEMCDAFSVGRTTIREALKVLEALGFIERSRRGSFVKSKGNPGSVMHSYGEIIKKARISDLFEARRALEVEIAALSTQNAGEDDIKFLQDIIYDMTIFQGDKQLFVENDVKFHTYLGEACGNHVLEYLVKQLYDLLIEVDGEAVKNNKIMTKIIRSHQMILEAIRRRSPMEAQNMMLKHLNEMYANIEQSRFNKNLINEFPSRHYCSATSKTNRVF